MDEKKTVDEVVGQEEQAADAVDTRRDFLTKLASAAGAVVAAGLVTGSGAEAAEPVVTRGAMAALPNLRSQGSAQIAASKLNNGMALSITNKQVVQSIARESLGINQPGAEVMELSLTWK